MQPSHNAGLMLGQRRRRWPNIDPALGDTVRLKYGFEKTAFFLAHQIVVKKISPCTTSPACIGTPHDHRKPIFFVVFFCALPDETCCDCQKLDLKADKYKIQNGRYPKRYFL